MVTKMIIRMIIPVKERVQLGFVFWCWLLYTTSSFLQKKKKNKTKDKKRSTVESGWTCLLCPVKEDNRYILFKPCGSSAV